MCPWFVNYPCGKWREFDGEICSQTPTSRRILPIAIVNVNVWEYPRKSWSDVTDESILHSIKLPSPNGCGKIWKEGLICRLKSQMISILLIEVHKIERDIFLLSTSPVTVVQKEVIFRSSVLQPHRLRGNLPPVAWVVDRIGRDGRQFMGVICVFCIVGVIPLEIIFFEVPFPFLRELAHRVCAKDYSQEEEVTGGSLLSPTEPFFSHCVLFVAFTNVCRRCML